MVLQRAENMRGRQFEESAPSPMELTVNIDATCATGCVKLRKPAGKVMRPNRQNALP
jgi:hypothetical protein